MYHDGGDRFLYALRAEDGSLIWKAAIDGQPNVDFLVTEKHIYVAVDTKFVVLERASGRRVAAIDEPGTSTGRFISPASFSGGRVFVTGDGAAICFLEPK